MMTSFLLGFILLVGFILIMRLLGAWMLRINDVIAQQKETNRLLRLMAIADGIETKPGGSTPK